MLKMIDYIQGDYLTDGDYVEYSNNDVDGSGEIAYIFADKEISVKPANGFGRVFIQEKDIKRILK